MGFRICYIASQASPDELVQGLGLSLVGTEDEMPQDQWWAARLTQSGWTILWAEDARFGQSVLTNLAALSQRYKCILCEVNETTIWSASEAWSEGRQLWKVTHAGHGEDRLDLTCTGELPASFEALKQEFFETQASDDGAVDHVFEIPLDLAAETIGFRHEDYLDQDAVETFFIVAPPAKKGLLSRLFGQ